MDQLETRLTPDRVREGSSLRHASRRRGEAGRGRAGGLQQRRRERWLRRGGSVVGHVGQVLGVHLRLLLPLLLEDLLKDEALGVRVGREVWRRGLDEEAVVRAARGEVEEEGVRGDLQEQWKVM
jgi:hypothetical protein